MKTVVVVTLVNGYLKFEVPGSVTGVTRATLRLYAYDGSDDGGSAYNVANLYRATTDDWIEENLTWENAPVAGDTPLSSAGAVSANTWVEFDVTAAIAGGGTYSFAISSTSTNSVYFYSKESGTNIPQLVISQQGGGAAATVTPAVTPTATPTVAPPDESLVVIEAESDRVRQNGKWTIHSTSFASGSQYLYSSGKRNDRLVFQFQGTRLDVVYIKHPDLGSFVIEMDGVPMQVVDAYADSTIFGATVSLSGLAQSVHTVRVYPAKGTIALDAFAVAVADNVPSVMPKNSPDGSLRIIESDAAEVQATGEWTPYDSDAASGGRYIYSSGSTYDTLSLTFTGSHLEIVYVKHPALGLFSIEIGGTPYQAVSSVAQETQFDARAVFDDLGGGAHTLRLVPVSGVIAIDAFGVK
jgi:hypothetical protein